MAAATLRPAGHLDARHPILLMGPTASGKTAVAMALSAWLPVEIVSVDSAQVYRGMDIGTAKPSAAERAQVSHHLLDLMDPSEAYSAARFRTDATAAIGAIRSRGRVPLLVGGTMLYFRVLREGLSGLPEADPALRAQLDAQGAQAGWPALHARLATLDPVTAARLAPTDAQRIQRALEVCLLTGRPMSELLARQPAAGSDALLGPHLSMALLPDERGVLHRRIEQRFDRMLADGLVDELRGLRRRFPLRPELPAMRSVGYRQAWEFLEGKVDLTTFRARGIAASRQLAKRQLTWLRRTPAQAFDCLDPALPERIARWLRS